MKKFYAILMMAATVAACVRENLPETIEIEEPEVLHTYTMTVNATKEADATKALTVSGSALNATWAVGDKVAVYNVTKSVAINGYLLATSAGERTTLEGTLTGNIEAGDNLKLSFLGAKYGSQDGTLDYIAANCDYAEATATVASVVGGNITTTADASFNNQQTIVTFSFTDGTNPIDISSLTISASSNKLVKDKFHNTPRTEHKSYVVTGGTGGVNAAEEHYSLVDQNFETKWCQDGGLMGGPFNISFNTPNPVWVDGYRLITADDTNINYDRNPKDWVLKGKLNYTDDWTILDQVFDDSTLPKLNYGDAYYQVNNPGSYKYFYFEVTATQGASLMQIAELRLWEGISDVNTVYGPLTITPASATNELTVALRNENGAADSYSFAANSGATLYTFQKDGITFEPGQYYKIRVPMKRIYASSSITILDGMTGENSDGGLDAFKYLFDGNINTKWCSLKYSAGTYDNRVSVYQDGWKDQVVWKTDGETILKAYRLTTGNDTATYFERNWRGWTIYGGNFESDNKADIGGSGEWTLIQLITYDTTLPAANTADALFTIPGNSTAYKYYKLVIDDIHNVTDNIHQMAEMGLIME